MSIGPRCIDGAERFTLELIEHHADVAGAINAKYLIVLQSRNDECTVRRSRVAVGLENPLAAKLCYTILRYPCDAAAIVRRPDTFLVGPHALGPGKTAAECGKIGGTQREILKFFIHGLTSIILTLFHTVIRLLMYTICEARTAADLAQVRELFLEYQATLGVDLCFQGFAQEVASLPGNYARPGGRILLAANGPSKLGVVALRPILSVDCEMKRLYVRATGRGAGLGRLLTEALMKEARLAGYRRVLLDTLPTMTAAQALYRSMGFEEIPAYCQNPIAGTRYMALTLK